MSNSASDDLVPPGADPLTWCVPLSREPISPEQAASVVPMLKAIADPARLRLLSLVLSHEGAEACVCDLIPHFDLSQPTISHHLKVLHESGLVDDVAHAWTPAGSAANKVMTACIACGFAW